MSIAEQDLRKQFREDLKALGRPAGESGATIGGDVPGGLPPAAAIDYAKLSPLQQIAVGLRGSTPARASKPKPRAPEPKDDAGDEPTSPDAWDDSALFVGAD